MMTIVMLTKQQKKSERNSVNNKSFGQKNKETMVQFFLHVKNRIFLDKDAFLTVEYPALPRVGEIFWLDQEKSEMLKEMIIEAGNVEYYQEYIKKGYDANDVYNAYDEAKSVKYFVDEIFDFSEACTVKRVAFISDGIHVEIGIDEEE